MNYNYDKILYEVLAWKGHNADAMQDHRSTWTRKTDAMQIARSMSKEYGRVEVNLLKVDPENESDLRESYLQASWEEGKRIC